MRDHNRENKSDGTRRTGKVGLTQSEHFQAMENLQEIQRLPSINAINLNYFGSEQCDPGYSFGPYTRTSYVLHFVRSGRGRLIRQETVLPIESGQAFLLYPGEETTYTADEEDPWLYSWIGFQGLRAEDMMRRAGFTPQQPVITCRNMDELMAVMDKILAAQDLTYVNELMRMGYLYQLLGLLTQNMEGSSPAPQTKEDTDGLYVRTAVSLLTSPETPQIKVSDVADAIGISRGYLTAIFKKVMKVSPQEFQRNFRMEKAGDLLRSSDIPVSAIAEELGYMDVLSFSKSFHRHFGVSPTSFREQKVVVVTGNEKGSYTSGHPL